jgi:hypothetical protein
MWSSYLSLYCSINKNKMKLSSLGKKFSSHKWFMYHRDHTRVERSRPKGNELCLVWFQLKILVATQCKNKNINITIWSRNSTQSTLLNISWRTWTSGLTLLITVTRFGNHFWLPTPLLSWGFSSRSWSWPLNRGIFRLLPPRFLRYVM